MKIESFYYTLWRPGIDLETREILSSCRSNPIPRHIHEQPPPSYHALSPYRNDNNLIIVITLSTDKRSTRVCNFAFVSSIAGGSFALRKQEVITGQRLREASVFRAENVDRLICAGVCAKIVITVATLMAFFTRHSPHFRNDCSPFR